MTTPRQAAVDQGHARYSTGKACKSGHVAERFVSSRHCVVCAMSDSVEWKKANPLKCAEMRKAWAAENPERHKAIKAAWNKANPEGQKARSRKWFLANKEKSAAAQKRWREANPEAAKASARRWQVANRDKGTAATMRRHAAELQRTPAWADLKKIEAFYTKAQDLTALFGVEHHVDHIIPLRGKTVSGLHVQTNLRVVPAIVNQLKGNRFNPAQFN